jgi:hypothetical protein
MMLIEEALRRHLGNHAGLAALVGPRIHPLVMPQGTVLPSVTYQKISCPVEYTMDDKSLAHPRFQFDCWAASRPDGTSGYSIVKDVAAQVKAALHGFSGIMGGAGGVNVIGTWIEGETDLFEPDIKLYRISIDVRLYHE